MIKRFFKFIFDVIRSSIKNNTLAYSAQSAFFMTISFIPLIILLLSLLKFLPFSTDVILSGIVSVFPGGAKELVKSVLTESFNKSGAAVISITAVSTLWAASFGVFSVVDGLNKIYASSEPRGFISGRIMSLFYTLVFLLMLILCLLLFVFGNSIADRLAAGSGIATILVSGRLVIGLVILTALFLTMYIVVPHRKTKISVQIPGAIVCSAGWIGFSYLFSYYYTNVADYSYLYGSLSVMVFFMLWLFVCIYILFLGAEINNCMEARIERNYLMKK